MHTSFLDEKFDARDKPISESSRKLYVRNLTKLNDNHPVTSFDFLKDPAIIQAKLTPYKPTTQRSYLIAICSAVKKHGDGELHKTYYSLLQAMNDALRSNPTKSDQQEANWMTQDAVNAVFAKQVAKVLPFLAPAAGRQRQKLGKSQFKDLLHLMVLSLYTLQMPRRNIDYTLMRLSTDQSDQSSNYLDLAQRKFVFNNYKTKGTYQSVEVEICDQLMDVIRLYLKHHPFAKKLKHKKHNVPFLVNYYGEPLMNSNDITKILNRVFEKRVGSSLLRNIYLTSKYADVIEDLEEDAANMSTSVDTALNHYIKRDRPLTEQSVDDAASKK